MRFAMPDTCLADSISIGKIYTFRGKVANRKTTSDSIQGQSDVAIEKQRFDTACRRCTEDFNQTIAAGNTGAFGEDVLRFYIELLKDPVVVQPILALLGEGHLVEEAVEKVFNDLTKQFQELEDEYFRGRAQDIVDVKNMLHAQLGGLPSESANFDDSYPNEDFILLAHTLTVPELLALTQHPLRGVLCQEGNPTSHAAIVAKGLDIPGWFGYDWTNLGSDLEDHVLILDGVRNEIFLDPSDEILSSYQVAIAKQRDQKLRLRNLVHTKGHTIDGRTIGLLANISNPGETNLAAQEGADGVGLFRTEFLFLDNKGLSEEEQYEVYSTVCRTLEGRSLTIRLADIGGDKLAGSIDIEPEQNPFLGVRGWRLLDEQQALLRTQVRALLRVSKESPIDIMIPMISTVEEMIKARDVIRDEAHRIGVCVPRIGIMVEVPSVAICVEQFTPYVDFFSIGTNDLTQYTLAADRTNSQVRHLYQELHPAILRLIHRVVRVSQQHNIDVSVCGELAGDVRGAFVLTGLGIQKLSMNPSKILKVKENLKRYSFSQFEELAKSAMNCSTQEQVRELLTRFCKE